MDWATAVKRCMSERGWSIEIMEDGGVTAQFPPGQEQRGNADFEECGQDAAPPIVPMSDEQLADFYDALERQIDCLRDAGLPYTELPSREQYVSAGGVWAQFSEYGDPEVLLAARRTCPDPVPS